MILSIKVEPLIRKKTNENYITQLVADEDMLFREDGNSELIMKDNNELNISLLVNSEDLYRFALLIINKFENESSNKS